MTVRELSTRRHTSRHVVVGYPSGDPFTGEQGQVIEDIITDSGTGMCMCRIRLGAGAISRPHIHNKSTAGLYCTHSAPQGVWTLYGWQFENAALLRQGGGKIVPEDVPHIAVMSLDDVPDDEDPGAIGYTEVIETRSVNSTRDDIEQLDELWMYALDAIRERKIPIAEVQKFVPEQHVPSLSGLAQGLWYPRYLSV